MDVRHSCNGAFTKRFPAMNKYLWLATIVWT